MRTCEWRGMRIALTNPELLRYGASRHMRIIRQSRYNVVMQEYVSEAVVLDKMSQGDLDNRFFLFTKRFGKLVAKAKSGRKITSKLSPHLEPGNVSFVRLIEKNGLQVGDALKAARIGAEPAQLAALNSLLSESEPDER